MVKNILVEDGVAKGVLTEQGEVFYAPEIVAGIGREGSEWFSHICKEHGIDTKNGTVDVGVRVEVRDEIMKMCIRDSSSTCSCWTDYQKYG